MSAAFARCAAARSAADRLDDAPRLPARSFRPATSDFGVVAALAGDPAVANRTAAARTTARAGRPTPPTLLVAGEPAAGVLDEDGVHRVVVGDALLAQPRQDLLEDQRHRPVADRPRRLELLLDRLHVAREPVDGHRVVLGDHEPVGVAATQQLGGHGVALVEGQEHLQAVAVEADVDAGVDDALDVFGVRAVAAVGDLDLLGRDALLEEDLDLARAGLRGGPRVGHDRRPRLDGGARGGAVDLLDVLGDARLVRCAL